MTGNLQSPSMKHYDVVLIGGAIMGASVAWSLTENPDFNGNILVVERDLTYAQCSTGHTSGCIRQQFSPELNIKISQYAAEFIKISSAIWAVTPECQSWIYRILDICTLRTLRVLQINFVEIK